MSHPIGKTQTRFFEFDDPENPLPLRVGPPLPRFTLAYEMYGQMNADRSNVILLYHAMTGSQHAAGINTDVSGPGRPLDRGGPRGLVGRLHRPGQGPRHPQVLHPLRQLPGRLLRLDRAGLDQPGDRVRYWGPAFPVLRMSDIVDSQMRLLDHLGVRKLHAVVGASIGGFLSLLTATRYPDRVQIVLPIGTGVETTIYQRIINFEQVTAIEADPNFRGGDYYGGPPARPGPGAGAADRPQDVRLARHPAGAGPHEVVSRRPPYGWYEMNHPVESYMLHQGDKFVRRFDANTYLRILDAWQWFDLVAEAGARDFNDLFQPLPRTRSSSSSASTPTCRSPPRNRPSSSSS